MGVCLIWTEDEIPKWVTVTANCNQIFSEYDPVISQLTNAMVRFELNADKSARWHVFTWELLQAKVYKNTNFTSLKKPGFLSLTPKNGVIEPFNLWGRDCRKAANECGWSPSSGNIRHTSVNLWRFWNVLDLLQGNQRVDFHANIPELCALSADLFVPTWYGGCEPTLRGIALAQSWIIRSLFLYVYLLQSQLFSTCWFYRFTLW